jgi:hypothetical protein
VFELRVRCVVAHVHMHIHAVSIGSMGVEHKIRMKLRRH